MNTAKNIILALVVIASTFSVTGCSTDAQMASHNLSKRAEQFEINRRVVFYNGITGEYILSVEGLCSIEADRSDNQLELTCKTGADTFKKHFLGLSDNVTYFAEQLEPAKASVYNYKVVFKPESILPDVDFESSVTN